LNLHYTRIVNTTAKLVLKQGDLEFSRPRLSRTESGHQPDDNGRGHHFAAARFAGEEDAGNLAEYVAFGCRGGKVMTDLQPLSEGLARGEQPEACAMKQYAEMWATITDQDALIYVRDWLEADGRAQALRLKYVPVVSQVLPGKKAATFFKLDRRLNMIIYLQLFSQIPLAHVKE
jgi:hypothetical protein